MESHVYVPLYRPILCVGGIIFRDHGKRTEFTESRILRAIQLYIFLDGGKNNKYVF